MKKNLLFVLLLISAQSYAVLPPLYQSMSEYKGLLDSQVVAEKLQSGEGIESIRRTPNGFIITTPHHDLQVDIVYDPVDRPGPSKFHFVYRSHK